jgi:ribosome maturation factor RimP
MATRRPTPSSRPKHAAVHDDAAVRSAGSEIDDHGEAGGHDGAVRLLEDAVEPVARAMGFEVVLLEWTGARGGRVVRVYLDHPNGVSLDDCTRMSGVLSNALDAAEADPTTPELAALLSQPYTLEVSSPGVDRPLVRLSHFARFVGGRAVVRTFHPLPGQGGSDQRTFHGRIVGTEVDAADPADDRRGSVLLRSLDSDTIYKISLADIRRANLVYSPPTTPLGTPPSTGGHG